MDRKTHLAPAEWYGYKRQYPARYRILKEYVRDRTWFEPITYDDVTFTEFVNPRRWFGVGQMMVFLLQYRHLKEYEYLYFPARTYKGTPTFAIKWDDKVLWKECDYFWSEVKAVLAILVSIHSMGILEE